MRQFFAGQSWANYRSQTRSVLLNGRSTGVRLTQFLWRIQHQIAAIPNRSASRLSSKLRPEIMGPCGEAGIISSLLRHTWLVHPERLPNLKQSDQSLPTPNWLAYNTVFAERLPISS